MSNDPITTASPGTLESWGRLVATVGFPTLAAGALIYVLIQQVVPAVNQHTTQMIAQTEAMRQQAALLGELVGLTRGLVELSKDTGHSAKENHDILLRNAEKIDEIVQRLRMMMGDDPWKTKKPPP